MRRPDIVVDCRSAPDRRTETSEPRVVIEVLSPSTMRFDRLTKAEEYRTHPSIDVILLVATEAPSVIVWRREGRHWMSETAEGPEAAAAPPKIGAGLALADIHADAGLEAA